MKRGHVIGIKQERRTKGTPWYAQVQTEALRKVEAAWQATQEQPQEQPQGQQK